MDKAGNIETAHSLAINIDGAPPTITAAASPAVLWPPNGKMVPVVIKGRISDSLSGVDRASGSYITLDSYGLIQPSGAFAIAADGSYSVGLLLEARRNGQDKNGRTYTITLAAKDNAGNIAHIPVVVTVPHNQ